MKKIFGLLLFLLPALAHGQSASFTISADTVCQDSCITFINTSTSADTIDSVRWFINGITISNPQDDTIIVCFSSAGIDTVNLIVHGLDYYRTPMTDTATNIVTIKPIPRPVVTDTFACGFKVPNVYSSYAWWGWGSPLDTLGFNYYIEYGCLSPCSGEYVIVDSDGCLGASANAGIRCGDAVTKVITPTRELTLYPNPATNELILSSNYPITTISIANLLGQSVLTNNYNTDKVTLDVADLPNGVYFMKVNGSEVRKFVKE